MVARGEIANVTWQADDSNFNRPLCRVWNCPAYILMKVVTQNGIFELRSNIDATQYTASWFCKQIWFLCFGGFFTAEILCLKETFVVPTNDNYNPLNIRKYNQKYWKPPIVLISEKLLVVSVFHLKSWREKSNQKFGSFIFNVNDAQHDHTLYLVLSYLYSWQWFLHCH